MERKPRANWLEIPLLSRQQRNVMSVDDEECEVVDLRVAARVLEQSKQHADPKVS